MKSFIIFFLAVTLAAGFEEKIDNPERIAKGTRAVLGQFPYQVGLDFGERQCSGSLIASEWVLTAANCLLDASSVKVFLGGIDFYDPDLFFTVNSSNFIQHENYDPYTWKNDICLIEIPSVKYQKNIQKIELPEINRPYPQYNGKTVVVSGWGEIDDKGNLDDTLRFAEMKVISQKACNATRRDGIDSNVICTNPINGGNVCWGDAGDPMVLKDRSILIGVNAITQEKCHYGTSSQYTRVTSYLDWIQNHTGVVY